MVSLFLYVILFLLFTFVNYTYETRSWHTYRYALGLFIKTRCDTSFTSLLCARNEKQEAAGGSTWKICVVGVGNTVEEEEYNLFDEIPPFATFTLPMILESETTPYLRSSHEGVTVAKGKKGKK